MVRFLPPAPTRSRKHRVSGLALFRKRLHSDLILMPGIVGLITHMRREDAEHELLLMLETLRHENFYVTGTWVDESLGVYVGWVARKGSFSDGMPLRNERGDVVTVFSGEEYPEPGVVQRLRERGHQLDAAKS